MRLLVVMLQTLTTVLSPPKAMPVVTYKLRRLWFKPKDINHGQVQ